MFSGPLAKSKSTTKEAMKFTAIKNSPKMRTSRSQRDKNQTFGSNGEKRMFLKKNPTSQGMIEQMTSKHKSKDQDENPSRP